MKADVSSSLQEIYSRLESAFGPQHWWPGETPFEVAVGAILTQNTSWSNASHAVRELKQRNLLSAQRLQRVSSRSLARWIRSSGYFNQKAKRLKVFVRYLFNQYAGQLEKMQDSSIPVLRKELLSLWGIGPETADSILLYALEKPIFVVDAYTRRVLARHSLISWKAPYEEIQALFQDSLPKKASQWNEYHALLVEVGKRFCHKTKPNCQDCPIRMVGNLNLEKHV